MGSWAGASALTPQATLRPAWGRRGSRTSTCAQRGALDPGAGDAPSRSDGNVDELRAGPRLESLIVMFEDACKGVAGGFMPDFILNHAIS